MTDKLKLFVPIAAAALLWFLMFSPWTAGAVNFWIEMSISAIILTSMALTFGGSPKCGLDSGNTISQILTGLVIAVALWCIFWVGDKLSSLMFDFARPGVDAVYSMKTGLPAWVIALLLLFVIGPAEEFFWRGFVQKKMVEILDGQPHSADKAFLITTAIYTLIHIWSFNFMLIMAALVAGAIWGLLYRINPRLLPALIVSHAVWDALVFVILPI